MLAHKLALTLCLGLLLAAPARTSAQLAPGPAVAQTPAGLVVELSCPAAAEPTASIDGGPPLPAEAAPTPARPLAFALVVERSPAMGEPGTPHSTRAADAARLATALVERLPAGSRVSVITFDGAARLALPASADRRAPRAALAALTPPWPAISPAPRLAIGEALAIAGDELRRAPEGPRAAAVFVAGAPELVVDLAPLRAAAGPEGRLLLVGLAPEPGALADDSAPLVPFHTTDSAALPGLLAGYARKAAWLAGADGTRLTIPMQGLAQGEHQITISGCGAPVGATFVVPATSPAPTAIVLPAALTCVGAGALLWGRRRARGGQGTARPGTARYSATASITTARRGGAGRPAARLQVVVWDGLERRVYPLERRQHVVGRDATCDISIESEWVSGLHARLTLAGERVEVTDLGSTNGTFVGDLGRPLASGAPAHLGAGDVVLIGPEVRLALELVGEPAGEEGEL